MNYKIVDITTHYNPDSALGGLSFFESERNFPFEMKRIYYIHGVSEGKVRGFHAHKALRQFLFCPYGSIKMILEDGKEKAEVLLDSPSKGLILEPCLWRTMEWLKDDSVLCVAASDYYDESDYIRNYEDFLKYVNEGIE